MANFTKSGFFDYSINHDEYSAADFAKVMYSLNGDGVDSRYGDGLTCSSAGNTITVASGAAWLQGYFGWNDYAIDVTVDTGTHKDLVCVHVDPENAVFELTVVKGTSSDYPTLTGNDYMPLYKAEVTSGTVTTLTDIRSFVYGSTGIDKQKVAVVPTGSIVNYSLYDDGTIIFRPTIV